VPERTKVGTLMCSNADRVLQILGRIGTIDLRSAMLCGKDITSLGRERPRLITRCAMISSRRPD